MGNMKVFSLVEQVLTRYRKAIAKESECAPKNFEARATTPVGPMLHHCLKQTKQVLLKMKVVAATTKLKYITQYSVMQPSH